MGIPQDVIAESLKRFPGIRAREEARSRAIIDLNPPARVTAFIAGATVERAAAEGGEGVLERILNGNDLMPINYLEKGLRASRSVGRVSICNSAGQVIGFGTGFLVAPRLLLTNNHVLETAQSAAASFVEFNFQLDINGREARQVSFSFDTTVFITSKPLDYTLVAVKERSDDGRTNLSDFGHLPLSGRPGKTLDGSFLTVIQHPSGERKQIALRENQLIKTLDHFLWYATDTAPGSSGACAFNDSWQVVALHHSGVPATDDAGNPLAIDGTIWTPAKGDGKRKWIANEGVRISSILADLRPQANRPLVRELLRDAGMATEASTLVIPSADASRPAIDAVTLAATEEKISIDPNYDNRHGYDPAFLGTRDKRVRLPRLSEELRAKAAPRLDADSYVLTYHHSSIVVNAERRLAFFTAVNIDGSKSFRLKRDQDKWFYDPRIAKEHQVGNELYAGNDLDRGHLVRRLDPAWGDTREVARVANDDTFHWTNCSPQHKDLNQKVWAGLEDFILDKTDEENFRATVFTGPIFRDGDRTHQETGVQIPDEFWKVVVAVTPEKKLSATGYVISQRDMITPDIAEAAVFGPYKTFQVPILRIAQETGLDFGNLASFDPLAAADTESTRGYGGKVLEEFAQIVI